MKPCYIHNHTYVGASRHALLTRIMAKSEKDVVLLSGGEEIGYRGWLRFHHK